VARASAGPATMSAMSCLLLGAGSALQSASGPGRYSPRAPDRAL